MDTQNAANYLGVSIKTLIQYTKKGMINPSYYEGQGGLVPDYSPVDLSTLKHQLEGQAITDEQYDKRYEWVCFAVMAFVFTLGIIIGERL